jgi:hypothetical protein
MSVVQQKPAMGWWHNIYYAHSNKVTNRIQTCAPLSHRVMYAFVKEFWRLLLEKVANLFQLNVQLKSASLECLLQWPKDVEVPGAEIQTVCQMLQYLLMHVLRDDACYHATTPVFHCCFWHTSIAVYGLHPLVDSPLHLKPESQHADLAWKDAECDIPLPHVTLLNSHTKTHNANKWHLILHF